MNHQAASSVDIKQDTLLIDIATRSVIELRLDSSLGDAVRIMSERRISSVVVTDRAGHPTGIVTERNILQAIKSGNTPDSLLSDVMSSPLISVPTSITAFDAYQLCRQRNIRHLVMVDENGLLSGVASETDFRQHLDLNTLAGRRKIIAVAKRAGIALPPDTGLPPALDMMLEQHRSCVVVVEDRKPVGIVTERDVVRFYSGNIHSGNATLGKVMSSPVLTIPDSASTSEAAELMLTHKVRHLVVVDGAGLMAGLVDEHDLTQAMVTGLTEERGGIEESFLRTLINTLPDLIWLKDKDGTYLACNASFERFLDAREQDIVGKSDYDFMSREQAEFFREHDRMAMEKNGPSTNEEWVAFADDGHRELLETIKTPMRDANGDLIGVLGIARNITRRKQAEEELRAGEEKLRSLYELSPMGIALTDMQGHYLEFNDAFRKICGYTRDELNNLDYWALTPKEYAEQEAAQLESLNTKGYYGPYEKEYIHKDGRRIPLLLNGVLIHGSDGQPYIWSIVEDITERKRDEEALRVTASVFDTTQEAILITDAANNIVDVNPAFTHITGYSREEVLGRNPKLLSSGRQDRSFYTAMWNTLSQKKSWRGEIWNRRKDGESYAELLSISVICDQNGKVLRHVGVFSDISHLKAHEAELSRVAHYDALTGIPNRVLLADRMKQAFAQTLREGNMLAVCYLDLDGFKPINDTLGHEAGDEVLIEVARRIERTIRGGDTVARLGGDEFVVALLSLDKGEECVTTLERLLTTISQPIMVREHALTVSASIGVSIYPLDDEDPDTLLRHADQAMYVAKQAGKNRFHIYDPALDLRARNQQEFLQGIRQGLEQGEFELYYQPKVDLRDRRLVGAEALIRWNHPSRGLLPPSEFLRLIENTDLDIELGDWVIDSALAQLERWRHAGLDIEVSINISAHHLESPHFSEKLQQALERYAEVPPGRLQIEVLETAALNDIAIVRSIIESCRKLGISFALDDFGTGYSSLSYLGSLPVDVLKIDQSFVRDMLEDRGDMAIVQGIIAMAHAFERKTVAEGIETEKHYRALLDMGCEIGQGYGIARPMTAANLLNWTPN